MSVDVLSLAPEGAIRFAAARSSGPGGQNVNKRSTKVELRVLVADLALPPRPLARLRALAGHAVTTDDELVITCEEHRSQAQNKAGCVDRLADLVARALVEPKVRRKTRATRASKERRLQAKKATSDRKRLRRETD